MKKEPIVKLHSVYLNPFQPFTEREVDNGGKECPHAIEDNLSRAVFSALVNGDQPRALLAMFLRTLALRAHGSDDLSDRVRGLAKTLAQCDPGSIECDLQTCPSDAMIGEVERHQILLIGVSSSHKSAWTHNARKAPKLPQPDAWIYVPGQMLLVFEFKNDENALDATQISAYAHHLGLLEDKDNVPKAKPEKRLASETEAKKVQDACADIVLDAPWSAVMEALDGIQKDGNPRDLGPWLCAQAAEYINRHVYPPYCGVKTILEWLNERNNPARRRHLRRLVKHMGEELCRSAEGIEGAITFAPDKKKTRKDYDLAPGVGSDVYVKLEQGEKPLIHKYFDREAQAVLWFRFSGDKGDKTPRIGLEYFISAEGCQSSAKVCDPADAKVALWNKASARQSEKAAEFEETVAGWIDRESGDGGILVCVSTLCFNGKKRNWQGGGTEGPTTEHSAYLSPVDALSFIEENREALWHFPRVGPGEEVATIEDAAPCVRKPALSLLAPLDLRELESCGESELQAFLQEAVEFLPKNS